MLELPAATRLILHGDTAARAAAAVVWGVGFSEQACRARGRGARATVWLGPDEYLLIDRGPREASLVDALEQALAHTPHALVDVSHRQVAYEIAGANAATLLGGACPLDFDLDEFPVDMCTRTVFAKAEILLWRTAATRFHIEVWRSFAPYFTALIAEIGRDEHAPIGALE